LLSIAPFVPCTPLLLSVLLETFPEPGSKSTQLVCEVVAGVIERLTRKEDLRSLLEKLCQFSQSLSSKALVQALSAVVARCEPFPDALGLTVSKTWIGLLLSGDVPNDTDFESSLKGKVVSVYQTELLSAMFQNPSNLLLWKSLGRILALKTTENTDKFLPFFLSTWLFPQRPVSDFSLQMLRRIYRIEIEIDVTQGEVFSIPFLTIVSPFMQELASKFSGNLIVSLLTNLLDYFPVCSPDCRNSISISVMFLISRDLKTVIKSSSNFVTKIINVTGLLKLDPDRALVQWMMRVLDLLAKSNPAAFFEQLRLSVDSEFLSLYLWRFLRSSSTALVMEIT
jgi:hypothetical protein